MMTLGEIAATPIREVANREPVRLSADTPLIEVVEALRDQGRGAALIEDGGQLVGVFTERDVLKRIDHSDHAWHSRPVRDVMTKAPTSIKAEQTLRDAIDLMIAGEFRNIPIVDDVGGLVGVLSIRDVLAHIVEHFPADFLNLPPDPAHEASEPWGG